MRTKEVIARTIEPVMGRDAWRITDEEIVRCRDCINASETSASSDGNLDCLHFSQWDYYDDEPGHWLVEPDGFCAWGERRDD